MNKLEQWFMRLPAYIRGGLIGLAAYAVVVCIFVSSFSMLSHFKEQLRALPPGSVSFLVPFVVISMYPGIYIMKTVDLTIPVLIVNCLVYSSLGVIIGVFHTTNKKSPR